MTVDFILHILNIFIYSIALLQVFFLLLDYYGVEVFIYNYYWQFFIDYIISFTQDLVVSTSVASINTILVVRTPLSPFKHGEKPEKFNGLNFKDVAVKIFI